MESSIPSTLKRELNAELALEEANLRSRSWYHGSISRYKSEQLVKSNGNFLVRDCTTRPGEFVLTCSWKGVPLHFMVNSTAMSEGRNSRIDVKYHFEDELFNSLTEMIRFYVERAKPVTESSSALISKPIPRTIPLSYYDKKFAPLTCPNLKEALLHEQMKQTRPAKTRSVPSSVALAVHRTENKPREKLKGVFARFNKKPKLPKLVQPETFSYSTSSDYDNLGEENDGEHDYAEQHPREEECVLTGTLPRFGSEPVLSPSMQKRVSVHGHVPYFTLQYAQPVVTGSNPDLTRIPPKPKRVPSQKWKMSRQLVSENPRHHDYDELDDLEDDEHEVSESGTRIRITAAQLPGIQTGKTVRMIAQQRDVQDLQKTSASSPSKMLPYTRTQHVNKNISLPYTKKTKKQNDREQKKPDSDRKTKNGRRTKENEGIRIGKSMTRDYHREFLRTSAISTCSNTNNDYDEPDSSGDLFYDIKKLEQIWETSHFRLDGFTSSYLPEGNKPLDASAMQKILATLKKTDPSELARHLTHVDCDVIRASNDFGMNVTSGFELLILPHGSQLRRDLLERWFCMEMFVSTTILRTSGSYELLHKWTQIAAACKAIGNYYSFGSIIEALCSNPICRLGESWDKLRTEHTETAIMFESQFRALLKSQLHSGAVLGLEDPDAVIPLITPIIKLLEKQSETELDDDDIEIIAAHLEGGRNIARQNQTYQENIQRRLPNDSTYMEELCEMFKTEMHLRLLFGCQGMRAEQQERYNKFRRLLQMISENVEE